MQSSRPTREPRLYFEQLEHRRPMAVSVLLGSGTLTITGDEDGNEIAIVGTGNPGEITVTGRTGTRVNGIANGSVTVQGVTEALFAQLGHGDNVVALDNLYLGGKIEIRTGDGNDRVVFGQSGVVSSANDCFVFSSGGANDVFLAEKSNVFMGGHLWVTSHGALSASLIGASARTFISVGGGFVATNNILVLKQAYPDSGRVHHCEIESAQQGAGTA